MMPRRPAASPTPPGASGTTPQLHPPCDPEPAPPPGVPPPVPPPPVPAGAHPPLQYTYAPTSHAPLAGRGTLSWSLPKYIERFVPWPRSVSSVDVRCRSYDEAPIAYFTKWEGASEALRVTLSALVIELSIWASAALTVTLFETTHWVNFVVG